MSHRRQSCCFILSVPLLLSKVCVALARAWGDEDRRLQLLPALMAPRPRTLHHAEDIGSALKGGVNVCQRQLVNEVLGFLVTEFVPNFRREDATPIQRGSNASLLGRVQAIKLIRHALISIPKHKSINGCPKKRKSASKKCKSNDLSALSHRDVRKAGTSRASEMSDLSPHGPKRTLIRSLSPIAPCEYAP
jgi:hypothetical protein